MNAKNYASYKKDNPYHVWVHKDNGTKFVGHFKNRADALNWQKRIHNAAIIGKPTTASKAKPKRRASNPFLDFKPARIKNPFDPW